MPSFAGPDEILGVFLYVGVIYLINLSQVTVESIRETRKTDLSEFLEQVRRDKDRVSDELLSKLRVIASSGPLRAVCEGDTAVGRTLEHALGILQNPSKQPDYLGIELKAYRGKPKQENRAGLFSQVPNWSMSRLKSSAEFLREFGYERRGLRRLNCTVSARIANSQGLRFRLDMDEEVLHEFHQPTNSDCAIWALPHLHARLLEKHRETFWIRVRSTHSEGIEYFDLESVRHTEKPSVVQFNALLGLGSVTMDHVIKETASGGAKDQGYLFKLNKRDIPVLFAQPRDYSFGQIGENTPLAISKLA
ncbi:MvaI/BcnI family restriction endonuclease [Tunturiibacter lichenicola]|uniref:MvaI/BcnI family restriction endonuclease n=1 Tax=Tunturiibacter lichenicola TaxID=2051959 RepID=UPI003D9AD612